MSVNRVSIDMERLIPHQRYLLKFKDDDYLSRCNKSDSESGSDSDSDSDSCSEEYGNTLITLEGSFMGYFDKSIFDSFKRYKKLVLNERRNNRPIPLVPNELKSIYDTDRNGYPILNDYGFPKENDLDFTDPLCPYGYIDVHGGQYNRFNCSYWIFPNIGLFKVLKIRHSEQWITEDLPSIQNVIVSDTDPVIEDSYIWVNLNYVDEIRQPIQDSQIADTISKLAYNQDDNPYNVGDLKPPIPEEIISHAILPFTTIGLNHLNKKGGRRGKTKKVAQRSRSKDKGKSKK